MLMTLKNNGLAWYVEYDESQSTNMIEIVVASNLSRVINEPEFADYGGDGTETYVDSVSGITFYKYTGVSGNQICAIPIEDNVFKLVSEQNFNETFLINADKSRLNLDVALKKSNVISKRVLLWTNSDPYNTYAAQVIELETLFRFDYIEIEAQTRISSSDYRYSIQKFKMSTKADLNLAVIGTAPNFYDREITINPDYISFGDCYNTFIYDGDISTGTSNGSLVPYRIYGVNE